MNNLVSIIMPCHNGEKFLRASINSVLAQDYADFELLVIDDHSRDASRAIVEKFCLEDSRVKLIINEGKSGAANARNLGICLSSGKYIAFLDCDDLWARKKLSRSISFMEMNDLAFTWSGYIVIDENDRPIRSQRAGVFADYHSFLSKKEVIGCLTAVYDTSKVGKIYAPIIKMRNDYALWVLIFKASDQKGCKYMGCSDNLAYFRTHSRSLTSNKFKAAYYQWILYRNVAGLGWLNSFMYMIQYFKNGVADRLTRAY